MKIIFTLLAIFIYLPIFGQETDMRPDQILFDEALDIYYDEEYDSALVKFKQFAEKYPKSPLFPRAKYNIGYILRDLDRDDEAILVFEEILASDFTEKDEAGGLMEQYTLYKHRSASHLAEIYLNAKDFEKAEKYIKLFDKKYEYKHFGGNEMMASRLYTAESYAKLYHGQGKTKKAINQLLPYMFDNGLTSNQSIIETLTVVLEEQYSKEELKEIIGNAYESLNIKDEDNASIKFLGKKIEVLDYSLFAIGNPEFKENLELNNQEKWQKVIRTHPLFEKYLEK
ncbi:tetratricopeptide repeat protein [Marivirga harenae]|uniref:tetratricopeptide repeat protein n=1 Tax=Marivirga harenae TaxID=2010992 RepID=UPI0026E07A53|nr:tetratricopeptide repeat protein [Marivirga harenae]WKV12132.1 hypothetical protein Q3Y49_18200 [Marivirga harenae]|tara:strand:- start:242830 stop:243681 length:852 start_codon:yes stop_codon:yes gene_type:complete